MLQITSFIQMFSKNEISSIVEIKIISYTKKHNFTICEKIENSFFCMFQYKIIRTNSKKSVFHDL